jgi:hypothetical protein
MQSDESETHPRRWHSAWWWIGLTLSVLALALLPWPVGAAMLLITVAGWRVYRHHVSRSR